MTEERLHIDWGNDKLHRTQKQVERNPYDLESWSILLREAQTKHISEVRSLYEHLIDIFPSASRYWRIYIEHEMKSRNFEKVEKVGLVVCKNTDVIKEGFSTVFCLEPLIIEWKRLPMNCLQLCFYDPSLTLRLK